MRYSTNDKTNGFEQMVAPVFKTILNELNKEISSSKTFPYSRPLSNIKEFDDKFEIHITIPGLMKEDIDISLDKDQLVVSANKEESGEINFKHREFKTGKFMRSFTLPESADKNQISAKATNGILSIIIHKVVSKPATKIEII